MASKDQGGLEYDLKFAIDLSGFRGGLARNVSEEFFERA